MKIFSIKGKYSEKIFSNEKLVELRRQDVKTKTNEKCLIYTTHPVKRITGYFIVEKKIRLPIKKLWQKTKEISGITKKEFINYFEDCIEGTAIFFRYVKRFVDGISIDEIKMIIKNFRPPQSYCNIEENFFNLILLKSGLNLSSLSNF